MVKFINVQIERLYLLLLPGVNVLKLDFTQLTKNKMFTINLYVHLGCILDESNLGYLLLLIGKTPFQNLIHLKKG